MRKPYWPAVAKCFEVAGDHFQEDEVGEIIEDFCDLYYEDHLRREWDEKDAEDRLEDIAELAGQIASGGNQEGGRARLEAFLQDVALLTNLDMKRNEPDADKRALRIALSAEVARVIARAMALLGIEVPERM